MYRIYRTGTRILSPFIPWYLKRRVQRGKEDETRIGERFGEASRERPEGQLIWLHGASVGEVLSLQALIGKLRDMFPKTHILVTSGTVTSARLMEERLPEGAFHQFIPLDHPDYAARFLDHWQPDIVLWAESDLWPNMLMDIKNRSIPAALINGRMSRKSFQRWSRFSGFAKDMLATFQTCLVQNEYEAEHFTGIGAQNVQPVGNLKYSAAPLSCDEGDLEELLEALHERPHWLFASTHEGEEEIALRVHQRLKKTFPNNVTIIAPRHPERRDTVLSMCAEEELKVSQRSKGALPREDDDIHLVDTLGELGLYFQAISLVVIGGSFIPHGGHNPIEPGRLDCQILYGPYMHNFMTICEDFENVSAARRLEDEEELYTEIRHLFYNPVEGQKLADTARRLTEGKAHVIDDIIAALYPVFERAGFYDAIKAQQKTG
ncbi:MAG: 3-deoxy-D-manno-octulosonic acid transferase [Micavibrio sp.]|nr:MAG: 3-deoxy-D-manno-octulosonic acid transferase [Micavibrio sp.]